MKGEAVAWMVASGNLNPPTVDSINPAAVSRWPGVVVPIPTLPEKSALPRTLRRLLGEVVFMPTLLNVNAEPGVDEDPRTRSGLDLQAGVAVPRERESEVGHGCLLKVVGSAES